MNMKRVLKYRFVSSRIYGKYTGISAPFYYIIPNLIKLSRKPNSSFFCFPEGVCSACQW